MKRAGVIAPILLFTMIASTLDSQQARSRAPRADSTTRVGFKERSPLLLSSRTLLGRRGAYQDIVLANPTDRPRTAVLRIRWLGADTTAHRAPVLFGTQLVDTVRVPARGEAVARLWANRASLPNEEAVMREGALVLTDSAYAVERQVVLDPANARGDSLLSPISSISFHVVRRCPFPFCGSTGMSVAGRGLTLPVFAQWDSSALRGAGLSLSSVLQGPRGESAVVESMNEVIPLGEGLSGLRLRATGLTRPGEYTGTLPLSASGGTVQLKISVGDWWVWAAIAILLGILLGYKLQRYTGVERAYWQLKARLARAAAKWRTAHEQFTTKLVPLGADAKRVKYSMADSVERERTTLGKELDDLAGQAFVPLDENNTKFVAVTTTIDELEKQIAKWPALGVALAAHHKAMADARPVFAALGPPVKPGRPIAIESVADGVFTGNPIEVSALGATIQSVRDSVGLVYMWTVSCQDLQECNAWLAEAETHGVPATELGPIANTLVGVHLDLWTATSAAELETRKTKETLNKAQKDLLVLLEPIKPPSTVTTGAGVSGAPPRVIVRQNTAYVTPPENEASWFERRVWTHDVALGALILAVAWASGFKLLYSDTFGTVPDYLTAVLWGFGSKTGIEALTTTLAKFFGK